LRLICGYPPGSGSRPGLGPRHPGSGAGPAWLPASGRRPTPAWI